MNHIFAKISRYQRDHGQGFAKAHSVGNDATTKLLWLRFLCRICHSVEEPIGDDDP